MKGEGYGARDRLVNCLRDYGEGCVYGWCVCTWGLCVCVCVCLCVCMCVCVYV